MSGAGGDGATSIEDRTPDEIEVLLRGRDRAELEAIYEAALDRLPSRAPIFTPTAKVPLLERIKGVEQVRRIYAHGLDATYRGRLRGLRERHAGTKRCFLIGNGPSLNRTDLAVLKDEVTFAVNGFFLKAEELDWTPTFYCVEDHLVAEDRAPWINAYRGPTKLFPAYLGYVFPPGEDTIFYNHRPRKSYPHGFDFSREADRITYTGCTVTFSMMQLAAYMGFEEIYLIGVDASYQIPQDAQAAGDYNVGVLDMKSDDPNHFNPDYFGKGFRWHDPQVHLMVEAYREARRALEGTGQTIYNATVGGALEVFERRAFADLFPKARPPAAVEAEVEARRAARAAARPPRMLVLDMTAMGSGSATGTIKANLLRDWADADLLQVASPRPGALALVRREGATFDETRATPEEARAAIARFAPEVVLYRPLADRPALHDFAMDWLRGPGRALPLVTWIMDDWPARLQAEDPARFAVLDRDLRALLARSSLRLSICEPMSEAFAARYGRSFTAFANGIDPAVWPPGRQHLPGPVLVRYAGALAPDMGAESVLRVARAVEALAGEGLDIRFEINTQGYWRDRSGHLFEGLSATSLTTEERDAAEYRSWLRGADVLLVSYNFDPGSIRYVRYSMANKMPECLASGAAVLGHGPREVATIGYMAERGVAEIVDAPDMVALVAALRRLADPARRQALAEAGRALALERHDLRRLAGALATCVGALVGWPADALGALADGAATVLLRRPEDQSGHEPEQRPQHRPQQRPEHRPDHRPGRRGAAADYEPVSLARLARALAAEGVAEGAGEGAAGGEIALLVHADPAEFVAARLAEGRRIADAVADWRCAMRRIMAVVRPAGRRCRRLSRAEVARLAGRDPAAPAGLAADPGADPGAGALLAAVAAHGLRADPEACRLLAELDLAPRQAEGSAAAGLPAVRAADLPADLPVDLLDGLLARIAAEREGRAAAEAAAAQARAQAAGLEATLALYWADAERLRADLGAAQDEIARDRARAEAAEGEIGRIMASRSMRLTAPLRGARRRIGAGAP